MRDAGVVSLGDSAGGGDADKPVDKLIKKWKKYAKDVHNFAGFRKAAKSFHALPPSADPRIAAKMLSKLAARMALRFKSPELRKLSAQLREASQDIKKSKQLLDTLTATGAGEGPVLQRPKPAKTPPMSSKIAMTGVEDVNLESLAHQFLLLNLKRNNPSPTQKSRYDSPEVKKAFQQYLGAKGYSVSPPQVDAAWQKATSRMLQNTKQVQANAQTKYFFGSDESIDYIVDRPVATPYSRMSSTVTAMDAQTVKLDEQKALKVIGAAVEYYAATKNPSKITEEDFRAFLREEYPVFAADPHFGYLWKGLYRMTHRPARHEDEPKSPKKANPATQQAVPPMRAALAKLPHILRKHNLGDNVVSYEALVNQTRGPRNPNEFLNAQEFQMLSNYGFIKPSGRPGYYQVSTTGPIAKRAAGLPVNTVVPLAKWLVSKVDGLTPVRALNWAKIIFKWLHDHDDADGDRLITEMSQNLDESPDELKQQILKVVNPTQNPTEGPQGGVQPEQPANAPQMIKATYRRLQAAHRLRRTRVASPVNLLEAARQIHLRLACSGNHAHQDYVEIVKQMVSPSGQGQHVLHIKMSPELFRQYAGVLTDHGVSSKQARQAVKDAVAGFMVSTAEVERHPMENDLQPTEGPVGSGRIEFAGAVIGCSYEDRDTSPTWKEHGEGVRFGEELQAPHDGPENAHILPEQEDPGDNSLVGRAH